MTTILLDVDGVINDLGDAEWEQPDHRFMADGFQIIIPAHVPPLVRHLVEKFNVVWLTTWRESANLWFAPFLKIPSLPVVTDGKKDRNVAWKAAAAQDFIRTTSPSEPIFWVEDFYEDFPWTDGVTFIDTGDVGVLTVDHLPPELRP